MICRGCGSQIPIAGKVCPHCQRDKTADVAYDTRYFFFALGFGVLGAIIGAMIGGRSGFLGQMAGVFVGVIVGTVGGLIGALVTTKSSPQASKPPEVRIAPPDALPVPAGPQEVASADLAEQRLSRLDALRAKGLITDQEHEAKREAILNTL